MLNQIDLSEAPSWHMERSVPGPLRIGPFANHRERRTRLGSRERESAHEMPELGRNVLRQVAVLR